MYNICRICLASEDMHEFESIFDNSGKSAEEIFLLSGLRILNEELAIICPECIIKLSEAVELRTMCLESSKFFEQTCQDEIVYEDYEVIEVDQYIKLESLEEEEIGNNIYFEPDLKTEQTEEIIEEEQVEDEIDELQEDYPLYYRKIGIESSENKCKICLKTFQKRGILDAHVKFVHLKMRTEKCQICYKTFHSKFRLKTHHNTVHLMLKNHKCTECLTTFTERSNLLRHMRTYHPESEIPPSSSKPECTNTDLIVESTSDHSYLQSETQDINCKMDRNEQDMNVVDVKYVQVRDQTNIQKLKEESSSTYSCTICFESFPRESYLKTHLETIHDQPNKVKCDKCDQEFTLKSNLSRHLQTKHREEPFFEEEDNSEYAMKKAKMREYKRKSRAKIAERGGKEIKPRQNNLDIPKDWSKSKVCYICGKEFDHQSHMRSHIRITHLREQTKKCELCDKYLRTHSDMRRHIDQVHKKIKDNICPICGMAFGQKQNLTKHIKVVHYQEKPFVCEICGKKFSGKHLLKIHSWTHSGLKPFKCNQCENRYRRHHHLKKHQLSQHNPDQAPKRAKVLKIETVTDSE